MAFASIFITAIIAFTFGGIIGALIYSRFASNEQKTRELEKHLHDKQDELGQYQQEVREHFQETGDLLRQLATNYRDVHNHLAQGAELLCDDNTAGPMIKKLPEVSAIEINETPESIQAPLDYAPKSTPFDKSVLQEDYKLEKVSLSDSVTGEDVADLIAQEAATANSTEKAS